MKATRLSPGVSEALAEFMGWIPDEGWDSDMVQVTLRLLASLRGGEEAKDVGIEPFNGIGWKEIDMMASLLDKIQDTEDVRGIVSAILSPGEVTKVTQNSIEWLTDEEE